MIDPTERLVFDPFDEITDPAEVLSVINSNPDWVAASDDFAGRTSWELSDAEMHLWKESLRENSVAFLLRWVETDEPVALGGFLEPHPGRNTPMMPLLLVQRTWQRQGIGTEAVGAILGYLADRGWESVLVTVLMACPEVRQFWEARGFEIAGEAADQDKRSVWVLERRIAAT